MSLKAKAEIVIKLSGGKSNVKIKVLLNYKFLASYVLCVQDIQDLILWILGEAVSPSWIFVKVLFLFFLYVYVDCWIIEQTIDRESSSCDVEFLSTKDV